MIRKVLFLFLLLLCCRITTAQTTEGNVYVKVNETSTITLSTTYSRVLQYNATGVSYSWSSSNSSIASVSYSSYKSCTVRGKAIGNCKVYFQASFYIDGYYRTYYFYWDVSVSGAGTVTIVNPTSASVIPEELTLEVGQEYQLQYSVYPVNATYNLEWACYDKSVATVTTYTGKVKAIGPGETNVHMWVFRNDGGCDIVKSCKVTVNNPKTIIAINDANVKSICLEQWDSDGDGELSEEEAASVTDIGTVFSGNTDIQSLDVLQHFTGLTSIGYEAFNGCCSLSSIIIPNSVTSIGTSAFIGCSSLSSIIIPKSIASIGEGVFQGCSALTCIDVENGNAVYDSRDNCNAIIQTTENKLIAGCGTTVIPNTVTTIGNYACQSSSLTSVTIPNSVVTIQKCAFRRCYNLTTVVIPEAVTTIGDRAFSECTNLRTIYCYREEPYTIASSVFDKIPNDAILYVPNGTKTEYELTEGWSGFMNIVEMGSIGNVDNTVSMVKSLWHQKAPYNNMIPNGKDAGCGPIAVAQILNYYKAPEHGFGHVTLYDNDLDYSSTSIDYNNILNEYRSGSYNQAQADAVANLIWHVGAAMTLKYNSDAAGAPGTENNRMVWGIQKYLHISQDCRFRLRKFYSTEQWMKMLDEQLEAGRPVYYRGRAFRYKSDSDGIGHLFVIDGKNSEGLYHINFGHGDNQQNKYASLNAINQSSGAYPGDYGVYYNWGQGMATDLMPDDNFDEETFNDYPVYLVEPLCLNNNKHLDCMSIATGGSFQLTMNLKVYNTDYITAKDGTIGRWQYALGVYSGKTLKSVIAPQGDDEFSSSSTVLTQSFEFPATIDNGEYELRVVTRYGDEELWQPVWDVAPNIINAVVDNNNVVLSTMGNHTLETNLYLLSPITEIGDASGDCPGKLFSLILKNPSDNNFENVIKFEVVSNEAVCATYEQNASVYSGCEVEYHFLIPNQVFDFTNNSDYTVKAYYYEHNQSEYIELTTDKPTIGGDIITFSDARVKAICVTNWDFNGDGELSKAEAAVVTDLGIAFQEDKTITSFEELQYFTGMISVGNRAFYHCTGLASIIIPSSVTNIIDYAFAYCSGLTSVTIPNSVTTIGSSTFFGCSGLTSITIPNSVTTIGSSAFRNCSGLTYVTIPNSVTSIGNYAFYGCSSLTSVTVEDSTPISLYSSTFSNSTNATLYVPYGSKAAYEAANVWKDFKEIVEIGEESVNNSLFAADMEALAGTKVVLPIELTNEDEVKLCQFDLRLPEGVTVATKSNGKLDVKMTERAENHNVTSQQLSNGDYRFVIASLDNDSFTGNEGTLVEITLDISETMEDGEYTVKVLNTELSVPDGNDLLVVKPADTESMLTVKNFTPGDVNNDGSVSVTDVGCTINYILEQVPSVFIFDAADMNGDKSVSVTDVGMIINLILNEGAASRSWADMENDGKTDANGVGSAHLSLQPTDEGYELLLENKEAFIGFQFDVELAEGASLNGVRLAGDGDDDHLMTYRRLQRSEALPTTGSDKWRVVCYSPVNSAFAADGSALVAIDVVGEASKLCSSATVSNIRLTTTTLDELHPVDFVGTTTGIAEVERGIKLSTEGGTLRIISDRDTTVQLFTLGGIGKTLQVRKGVNTFDSLRAGIYMIGNQKVIVR